MVKTAMDSSGTGLQKRYILTCMCFVGTLVLLALRLNLSIAIVSMVTSRKGNTYTDLECPTQDRNISADNTRDEFTWDPQQQGYILGGYYYGNTAMLAPGGVLAQHFGGKRTFGVGMMAMTVFTLLTPVAARFHLYALVAVRILLGAAGGIVMPTFHVLLGKWSPKQERSRMGAFISIAFQLGPVVSNAFCGVLVDSAFLGGWPSAFYVLGVLSFMVCILWMFLISESPLQHPSISEKELQLILITVKHGPKKLNIPWCAILTSLPFWSLLIGQVCGLWGIFTMYSYLPRYIEQTSCVSIQMNGLLTATPYLVCCVFVLIGGFLADFLHHKGLSTKVIRKIMASLGLFVPAGFLVAMGYTQSDASLVLLSLALGFFGFFNSGIYVNYIDIAPRYAGVLLGLVSSVSSVTGFAAPYVIGSVMSKWDILTGWRIVFFITSGIFAFGAIAFILFADGSPQAWAIENETVETMDLKQYPCNDAHWEEDLNKETREPNPTNEIAMIQPAGQLTLP